MPKARHAGDLREASFLPAHVEDAHDAVKRDEADQIVGWKGVHGLGQRPLGLLEVLGADSGVDHENVHAWQLRDWSVRVG